MRVSLLTQGSLLILTDLGNETTTEEGSQYGGTSEDESQGEDGDKSKSLIVKWVFNTNRLRS